MKMSKLRFQIEYHTKWGECLQVELQTSNGESGHIALSTKDGLQWCGDFIPAPNTTFIRYVYCVYAGGKIIRKELRTPRLLQFHTEDRTKKSADTACVNLQRDILFSDCWTDESIAAVYNSKAFRQCIYREPAIIESDHNSTSPYKLRLEALPAPEGFRWGVLGSSGTLGQWRTDQTRIFRRVASYTWEVDLDKTDLDGKTAYKIVLVNENNTSQIHWEKGEDRYIPNTQGVDNATIVWVNASAPRFDLPRWRGAGIVLPVFSLRSRTSFGVGDFGDLRKLIDWAHLCGLKAVQILPINDTTRTGTWADSYPYNAISVFALHPIYMDLNEWGDLPLFQKYREQGEELNALPQLDYERTYALKTTFLHELFALKGKEICTSEPYSDFVRKNKSWLDPYVSFCHKRDKYGSADFRMWPQVKATTEIEYDYYTFVQFLLFRQLSAVHKYATEKGILLKGDIPIGVSRDSATAWHAPHLFHFEGSAGAPPDAFAVNGQNWGFPTYNWDAMAQDNYAWWRERLKYMGQFFDAYRIDHVLGFFRIWEIPVSQTYGTLGYFRPALPLSMAEIAAYGFNLPVCQYVSPRITELDMAELGKIVRWEEFSSFVDKAGGYYVLKSQVATQKEVLKLELPEVLKKILLDIVADVLFIEDPEKKGFYHPRIAAQKTRAFAQLPTDQQQAFNRLHDDFFYNRHNHFWAEKAAKKLAVVTQYDENETMLPCAEDLGMVPAGVKEVLNDLHILSLEIESMPKTFGQQFADLKCNPYCSVATIATHDMPPFRLWWQQDAERRQDYWTKILKREGKAPESADYETCEAVVRNFLAAPSMLCLIAFQDFLAMSNLRNPIPEAEQINDPANSHHYWRYRMHLNIEDLVLASDFTEKLRALIKCAGR